MSNTRTTAKKTYKPKKHGGTKRMNKKTKTGKKRTRCSRLKNKNKKCYFGG